MSTDSNATKSLASTLRTAITGDVLVPGDDEYETARAVWNGRIDRFPSAIVRVASAADVAAAPAVSTAPTARTPVGRSRLPSL